MKAQISPIVHYTANATTLPDEVDKRLSRMTYKFIGNGSEKESRALLCKRKTKGGLDVPNWRARCNSAMALWAVKATNSDKPWTKLLDEPGIDWSKDAALYTIRSEHGVEGFLGKCVTEWYRAAACLPDPQPDKAIV